MLTQPLHSDVTLSSGLVVRHRYMANGAQETYTDTRDYLTHAEYAEYTVRRDMPPSLIPSAMDRALSAPERPNLPATTCPNCKRPNALTPRQARAGYQCNRCADAEEGCF